MHGASKMVVVVEVLLHRIAAVNTCVLLGRPYLNVPAPPVMMRIHQIAMSVVAAVSAAGADARAQRESRDDEEMATAVEADMEMQRHDSSATVQVCVVFGLVRVKEAYRDSENRSHDTGTEYPVRSSQSVGRHRYQIE